MASVERRLQRLEARTPPARDEEEVRAAACRRMSTEDLTVLEETLRRLEEMDAPDPGWEELLGELSEEKRDAFAAAWGRYEEAMREAARGR
ncbi:MAG: hypothetical protein M3Q49_17575 [Actinomycetota bacterium]|nr:hypothetical protein [Actinomycetota bacterium]